MSSPVKTILKLLVASLIVGWILKALDLDAEAVLRGLGGIANSLMDIFAGLLSWAVGPILVGAVVVIPIWLIVIVWRKATDRRS